MNIFVKIAVGREIKRLEGLKESFPNDDFMYEPNLSELRKAISEDDKDVNKFDSEGFIKEMETLDSVEDIPLDYEDYEKEQEQITERELRGGI